MTKGERIVALRESKGMSQTELADKIGVSKQLMYKYENDIITNIPSDKIYAISVELNTSPAYIMGWEEETRENKASEIEQLFALLTPEQQKLVSDLIRSFALTKKE